MKGILIVAAIIILSLIVLKTTKKGKKLNRQDIQEIVKKIGIEETDREINFTQDVLDFFKSLYLSEKDSIPFLINGEKFGLPENSIFMGVYHESNNTITNYKGIKGISLDPQIQEILSKAGEDGIVVLK